MALLLVVLVGLSACGIKGEPVTPAQDTPPIPTAGNDGGLDL
ncbi:MAG: hypothetical protein QM699_06210 [Amaricoccus sp.]